MNAALATKGAKIVSTESSEHSKLSDNGLMVLTLSIRITNVCDFFTAVSALRLYYKFYSSLEQGVPKCRAVENQKRSRNVAD